MTDEEKAEALAELKELSRLALKHRFVLVEFDNYDIIRQVYRRWWWARQNQRDPADPEEYDISHYGGNLSG